MLDAFDGEMQLNILKSQIPTVLYNLKKVFCVLVRT